ncbi:sialin isoform X2 [Syngnathus acus]|uniref:sialin isoform X2 n=1 Tax=Syngnathus acus TaxID=161584 RepID=UPI00188622A8|nr:sialin isoform X2 [Syngnathus acus]
MAHTNGSYSINAAPSDQSEDDEPLLREVTTPPLCCSARLNLAVLMFLGIAVVYGLRVNLSVAMVAMVNTSQPVPGLNGSTVHTCPLPSGWDNTSQTFEQPEGGVTFPAMMAMWAHWAPPLERSRLLSISGNGANFGAFLAMPLTGYICQALGWPAVFYICGGAGCLWAVLWFLLASDDPSTHRRISKEERDYIISSIRHQGSSHGWSVPVLSMLTSVPLWAIIITQMCYNWSFYTQFTSLPTYLSNILHFDLKSNGFVSALPYLAAWLCATLSGFLADSLIERKVFSVTTVRKLFTLTGMLFPAGFLLAVAYSGCSHALTIVFFTLTSATGGTSGAGVYMNQIDIAPRYAGFLLGITNTFGTIPGVIAPIATGYFTHDHTLEGWRKVFWVCAGVNVCAAVFYTLLGSGEVQPWAIPEEESDVDEGKGTTRSVST